MVKKYSSITAHQHLQISNWGKAILMGVLLLVICFSVMAQNITRPNIEGPSGLQVNSYTGSLFYQRTDLFVPGRGLSMDISFTYNSSERTMDWGYGFGWTFNYNRFYTFNDSSVTFYNSDGRKDQFKIDGSNYKAPVGIFDIVTKSAAGKYKLVTKDGTQYFFDDTTHKKLTSIQDRNGNQLTVSYTGNVPASITDGAGRTITLQWINNKLTLVKADFSGAIKQIEYTYDPAGLLLSVKDPAGNFIRYTYIRGKLMGTMRDGNGNLNNILYNSNNAVTKFVSCESEKNISYNAADLKTYVTDVNNEKNFVTTYSFDNAGRLFNKAGNCCGYNTTYSYDNDNNINLLKDANGNTTIYSYDARGNLLSETDPLGQAVLYTYERTFNQVTSSTDKRGNKIDYGYDAKGNLIQIKEPLNTITSYTYETNGDRKEITDPKGNKTIFAYDNYGYLTILTDANGGNTSFTHDIWGNRLTQQDANNHITTFGYDVLNRVVSTTNALGNQNKYVYDANGNTLSVTDANNNTTSFVYDSRDNLLIKTDAASQVSLLQYDAVGNMVGSTDANGNKTMYTYDKQSRKESVTNATNDRSVYAYDGNGNRTTITYPNGNRVTIKYDALNRVTNISDLLGIVGTYQYDANNNKVAEADAKGNESTFAYDALNRLITKTDPLGNGYTYAYDANGNIINEKDRNGNSSTYQYDVLNRMVKNIDGGGFNTIYNFDAIGNLLSVTDAKGNITAYTYDAINRNVQEKFADNTTKIYTYDAVSNLQSRKDNNGQITNYSYDKLYRPIAKIYPGGVDSLGYDATGHLIKAINSAATVLFNYDKAYRVLGESLNGKSTGYSYNIAAGTKQITYPGGRVIERKSDERNQLKAINEGTVALAVFDYNNAGENTIRRYANGTGTNIQYNGNNQVTALTASPSAYVDLGYTYDKEGNPLSAAFGHRSANSEQYSYDVKNQLTQFKKGSNQQSVYNYDGVGNRVTTLVNGVTTNYTTNAINAYTSITQGSPINQGYDANGNLISEGSRTFSYDIENRLTAVDAGATATYIYDALGRRIKKEAGANIVYYYFNGLQVIEERNGFDSLQATYVLGTWLDDIVNMKRNGKPYYYQTNTIGSVLAVTDSLGAIAERYEYDAFGKVGFFNGNYTPGTQSAIGNNYTYTGREYDSETGNLYFRARFYNSIKGRFFQKDPIGFYGGDINLYAYVKNQPTFLIDPLGLQGLNFCPDTEKEKIKKINDFIKKSYKIHSNDFTGPATVSQTIEGAWEQAKYYRDKNDASNEIDRDVEYYLLARAIANQVDNPFLKFIITNATLVGLNGYNVAKPIVDLRSDVQATSKPGGYLWTQKGGLDAAYYDVGTKKELPRLVPPFQPNPMNSRK
jgi:RHS repeat-associated protein